VGIFAQTGCGDILTSGDVGISLTWTGVSGMARGTIEVREPRDIGDAIRVVREARGISQEELAQANAYDRFYLYRPEAGRNTRPRHSRVMAVLFMLGGSGSGGPGGVPGVVRAGGCDAGVPGRFGGSRWRADRGCGAIWLWPSGRFRRIL